LPRFILPRFILPRFTLPRFILPRFILPRFILPAIKPFWLCLPLTTVQAYTHVCIQKISRSSYILVTCRDRGELVRGVDKHSSAVIDNILHTVLWEERDIVSELKRLRRGHTNAIVNAQVRMSRCTSACHFHMYTHAFVYYVYMRVSDADRI
jgi:hypothetical protein